MVEIMKRFARWLYMQFYKNELRVVAKYCKRDSTDMEPGDGLKRVGEITGALDTLTTLDLFYK